MIPKRVVLENFLSFGEKTEFTFEENEPLWVLCGPNGVGKSAVFDAITYALFGCHRGGKGSGMDKLIRHGTNGFHIEFEFAFAGKDYRIQRNYGKKSVERIWKSVDGGWDEIKLETGAHKLRKWTERELGLTYEQFTASVLLRQGEADAIITSTGSARLEMLKKIIGVERYEQLSARAQERTKSADQQHRVYASRLEQFLPVSEEQLAEAGQELEKAQANRDAAVKNEERASVGVAEAKEFQRLEQALAEVSGKVRTAEVRQKRAAEIAQQHARLNELDGVVPQLGQLIEARTKLAELKPKRDELNRQIEERSRSLDELKVRRDQSRTDADQHEKRAEQHASAIRESSVTLKSDRDLLKRADDVEEIDRHLAIFSEELDTEHATAQAEWNRAKDEWQKSTEERSSIEGIGKQKRKERKDFDSIEVGVTCSRCRQPVDAEHAEREKAALDAELQRLQREWEEANANEKQLKDRKDELEKNLDRLTKLLEQRKDLVSKRLALTRYGELPTVSELSKRIRDLEAKLGEWTVAEAEERKKAESARKIFKESESAFVSRERELKALEALFKTTDSETVRVETQFQTRMTSLAGDWAERASSMKTEDVTKLHRELKSLQSSDVAEQFRKLQEDSALRAEWDRQMREAQAKIAEIPEASRIDISVAEQQLQAVKAAIKVSGSAVLAAERVLDDLRQRQTERQKLQDEGREAEERLRLNEKLKKILGAEGLLRDLVRSAEKQIVKFANDTVSNLSDGDLSIELEDDTDGQDKAFTLKVRRIDSEPIGVQYLSGSQKFRVAVAVALAIGRFAASGTQSCPLESVIIDEGFGSLDRDGLRSMAEELTRLKDKAALKRIVLVSHQDEFVKAFPVGWQLSRGENGTVATRFRR